MREKIKNIFNNKKIVISLTITLVLLLAVGATYAWWAWNSSDNTNVAITIGNVATINFPNGQEVDDTITPVYNGCSGISIPFNVVNNYNVNNKLMIMHVYFDIEALPTALQTTSLKYQLLQEGTVIAEGNFSAYASGDTITVDDYVVVPTGTSNYTFVICLDGNGENVPAQGDIIGTLTPEIEIVDIYSNPNDWIYVLGTDKTTVDSIEVNMDQRINATTYEHNTVSYTLTDPITIAKDEILLTSYKYNGSNPNVYVPDTMTVNGITYKVKLLTYTSPIQVTYNGSTINYSYGYSAFNYNKWIKKIIFGNNATLVGYNQGDWDNSTMIGTFYYCTALTDVLGIPSGVNNFNTGFKNCTSLVYPPVLPSSATNLMSAFQNDTALIYAPAIPSGVTTMSSTFDGDTNLTTATTIPASVTDLSSAFKNCTSLENPPTITTTGTKLVSMAYTFSGCTSLTTAPTIPANVTNMNHTFANCTSLAAAPSIPSKVTNMSYTFDECANMTTAPSSIPVSVTNLEGTFRGSGIINPPTIPSNSPITSMNRTFGRCASLRTAPTIPNSVTDMSYTFWGCSSLVTPPTLPSTVTNMFQTFMDCTSLTIPSSGYTIPASVRNIGNTFRNCTSLKSSTSSQVINFATTAATFVNEGLGPLTPFSETTQTITARVTSCTSTTAKYLACNKPSNVPIKLSSGTTCSPTATCPTAS